MEYYNYEREIVNKMNKKESKESILVTSSSVYGWK